MLGHLLSAPILEVMVRGYPLPAYAEPPWADPAYGLGLMVPATAAGMRVYGHSGEGPGSQIAVYGRAVGNLQRTVGVWMPTNMMASDMHRAADRSAVHLLMEPHRKE